MQRFVRAFPVLVALALSSALSLACSSAPTPEPKAAEPAKPLATPGFGERAASEPETALPVELDDIQIGAKDAKVTIIAFLDFECQFCKLGFESLLAVRQHYSQEDLRVVIKHMPLDFHPSALPAAVAAQAVQLGVGSSAALEFSTIAFARQSEISYSNLAAWADEVGLPRERYNELVSEPLTVKRVASDVIQGRRLGVEGTPAFFVNGRMLIGAQPPESLAAYVEEEKAKMAELLPSRSWADAYAERLRENTQDSLAQALLARDPDDYRVPVDGSPSEGPADALVTVTLFTDFECPYCKRVEPTLRELHRLYPNQIRWVFKHKPLPFHKRARPAALVAAAIHEKKGAAEFFVARDEFFESSPDLSDEVLLGIGTRHGLTKEEVAAAISGQNAAANRRVQRDEELGDDVETEGTPHFFINGKRLSGARPAAHFRALIDREKKRAEALVATGVAPAAVYEALQKEALSPGTPKKVDVELTTTGHPTRGSDKAPVVIHVWSDFECPYCRKGEETLAELERLYPRQIQFVWHDLPLDFHKRALPAARAAREAFRQKGNEGFWKMHDLLFGLAASGAEVEREQLLGHAQSLGLKLPEFTSAIDSEALHPAIEADKTIANTLGIRGTPAFVIGGYLLAGARPLSHFERLVKLALEDAKTASAPTKPAAATTSTKPAGATSATKPTAPAMTVPKGTPTRP